MGKRITKRTKRFDKALKHIKDRNLKIKIWKQIKKIIENPEIGKPLRYKRGERSLYIKPFRLLYVIRGDEIILLKFDHRKKVYLSLKK